MYHLVFHVYYVGVPSPPTNPSIFALVSTSDGGYVVRLEWSPPLDDGGATVTSYQIFIDKVMENITSATEATIGLISVGEYLVQVRAVNCAGYSDNVSLSTLTLTSQVIITQSCKQGTNDYTVQYRISWNYNYTIHCNRKYQFLYQLHHYR